MPTRTRAPWTGDARGRQGALLVHLAGGGAAGVPELVTEAVDVERHQAWNELRATELFHGPPCHWGDNACPAGPVVLPPSTAPGQYLTWTLAPVQAPVDPDARASAWGV
jgi:hypothetical protein